MREESVNFNLSARYFTSEPDDPKDIREVWYVLHGYGQLAEYFLRKFKGFEKDDRLIVAPEGISRFYLNGFSGRVGATWMTKEDRLRDIQNYINYLNEVDTMVFKNIDRSSVSCNILGFSQGVATASRWISSYDNKFERIVFWAGVIPPDLDFDLAGEKLSNSDTYIVYGSSDPYISENSLEEQSRAFKKLKIDTKKIVFDGEHDITQEGIELLTNSFD